MSGAEPQRHVIAVIPARFDSSRFPGKPLAAIAGLPMIAHVVRRASRARLVGQVWVATDDARVARVAEAEGARAVWTRRDHVSGTDRVAEAARGSSADVVLNVQGDEPLIDPRSLDRLAAALLEDSKLGAATLAWPIRSAVEWRRPDVVKVVAAEDGSALYFSRAPIPFARSGEGRPRRALKHVGIYAFRRTLLLELAGWEPTPLERAEGLEQLRLLERGIRVRVVRAASDSVAVDRPEDVARVEEALARAGRRPGRRQRGGRKR